jgi:hypothetical protein
VTVRWMRWGSCGHQQGRPEITAIVAFDAHCYLRFVRGASPLFLHEKFSQPLQIFIVLYNEPSWTEPGAASEREEPNTSVLARTNSNSRMETRGAPRHSDLFSWPSAWCGRWDLNPHGIAPKGF